MVGVGLLLWVALAAWASITSHNIRLANVRYLDGLDSSPISAARLLDAPTPQWWLTSPLDPGATWVVGSAAFLLAAVGGLFVTLWASDEGSGDLELSPRTGQSPAADWPSPTTPPAMLGNGPRTSAGGH